MSKGRKTLVLHAGPYPYDTWEEHPFLGEELKYLRGFFDQIIVLAYPANGKRPSGSFGNVHFLESYRLNPARVFYKVLIYLSGFLSKHTYLEIKKHRRITRSFKALRNLIWFVGLSNINRVWLVYNVINKKKYVLGEVLFYTYWLDCEAFALGLLKNKNPAVVLISRAHGYEINEDRHAQNYFPCRDVTIKNIDYLFFISEHGKNHLESLYPELAAKSSVSPMGIQLPDFLCPPSADSVLRVVSCSNLILLKRIDLIMNSLILLAEEFPSQKIEWIHFGGGPLFNELKGKLQLFPDNLSGELKGNVSNKHIWNHYKENPVDVFIHLSESEGRPIAIQEAMSCGIPVIATDAGGVSEIVSNERGYLLPLAIRPEQVSKILATFILDKEQTLIFRKLNYDYARKNFDSKINYHKFIEKIGVF